MEILKIRKKITKEEMKKVKSILEERAKIFRHFSEKELEKKLGEISNFKEPFATVIFETHSRLLYNAVKIDKGMYRPLKYMFLVDEVANKYSTEGLLHIGGWAVYLVYCLATGEITATWRGSHDLDSIDTGENIAVFSLPEIKHLLKIRERSTAITNKWAIIFGMDNDLVQWDIYYPSHSRVIIEDISFSIEDLDEFSVKIGNSRIINPLQLLLLKLRANRYKDKIDMMILLRSLEKIGCADALEPFAEIYHSKNFLGER